MTSFPLAVRARRVSALKSLQIVAIAALDDLVVDLVKRYGLEIPSGFLDWIADIATPMVELKVERYFENERFTASLLAGDPKIAMARWVWHWVHPRISAEFQQMRQQIGLKPDLANDQESEILTSEW